MKNWIFLVIFSCMIFGCQKNESGDSSIQVNDSTEVVEEQKTESPNGLVQEGSEKPSKEKEEKWLTTERLWEMYNEARAKVKAAEKKDDFEEMSKYSYESAIYANALERNDIEAWQYNNAAYYLIKAFKQKTNYQAEMDKLNNLELKEEILEFREKMKQKFRKEQRLLSKAEGYLIKAKEIDEKLEASERTQIIANNALFVNDVLGLVDMGDNK